MYLTVQFKNRNMEFTGKTYDFQLAVNATPPQVGDVIRMFSEDGSRAVCNGTRVKVIAVKDQSDCAQSQVISYARASMDEPSISGL